MRSKSLESSLRTAVSATHDAVFFWMSFPSLQRDTLMMQDGISFFLHNAGNRQTNSTSSLGSCRSPGQTDPFQSHRSFQPARTTPTPLSYAQSRTAPGTLNVLHRWHSDTDTTRNRSVSPWHCDPDTTKHRSVSIGQLAVITGVANGKASHTQSGQMSVRHHSHHAKSVKSSSHNEHSVSPLSGKTYSGPRHPSHLHGSASSSPECSSPE